MKHIIIILSLIATTLLNVYAQTNKQSNYYPDDVIVNARSNYVLQNDTFYAQVIPINSSQWDGQISFENTGVKIIDSHWENGVLKVAAKADKWGLYTFSGKLNFKTDEGNTFLPFSSEFIVAIPVACIQTTFLIKDIENPVEITVSGIPGEFYEPISPDAEIKKLSNNKYTITPHKTGYLNVKVKSKDGKIEYGSYDFEVIEKK